MAGTELAKAYVQIIPSAEGIKGRITEALGGEAHSAGKSAGGNIASSIKRVIAAAGIGQALKTAISEGADLQQSVGGIETLFKESSDKVIANAKRAYETAGMSANQYMETVTSFSASLLQGLAGDTETAANVADMALTDMSDNANKMGTSMEMIQNAYQGFAKQNYTMLDNLKLGYGGTKTEMERLLADAEKLSGVKYDLSNLSDVYNAIHVIQEEMGITGTTTEEASETFSGSLAAMVSAGKNLLANLTLGEDIMPSLTALADTVGTFAFNNLFPMIGNILSSVVTLILENGDELIESGAKLLVSLNEGIGSKLPDLGIKALELITTLTGAIFENLPQIVQSGTQMIGNLVQGIIETMPKFIETVEELINTFLNYVIENLPEFTASGIDLLLSLVNGIVESLPEIISAAIDAVFGFLNTILENAPQLIEGGLTLIGELLAGIISAVPDLIAQIPKIISDIIEKFEETDWLKVGSNILGGIAKGIANGVGTVLKAAREAAQSALKAAKEALGIHSPSRIFEEQVGKMIDLGLAAGIENNINAVSDSMKELSQASVGMIETDFMVSASHIPDTKVQDKDSENKMIVIHTHVDLDGREVARGTAEYISDQLPWEEL